MDSDDGCTIFLNELNAIGIVHLKMDIMVSFMSHVFYYKNVFLKKLI